MAEIRVSDGEIIYDGRPVGRLYRLSGSLENEVAEVLEYSAEDAFARGLEAGREEAFCEGYSQGLAAGRATEAA